MLQKNLGALRDGLKAPSQHTQALHNGENDIAKCLQKQAIISMPRKKCPHNKHAPMKFLPTLTQRKKPPVIQHAMFKAHLYNKYPLDLLVHLLLLNPDYRKKRSERREAIAIILQILICYTDLETMEIKVPRKGRTGFIGLSLLQIARMAKLSISRVKTAIRDLKLAQYLIIGKRVKINDAGDFRSVNAHKKLTPLLWQHLGIELSAIKNDQHFLRLNKPKPPVYFEHQIKNIRTAAKKTFSQIKSFTEKIPRQICTLIAIKTFGCPA